MFVVDKEKFINYVKNYSYIGDSGFSREEQECNIVDWVEGNCFEIPDIKKIDKKEKKI